MPHRAGWLRARAVYFHLIIAATLAVAFASFVRDRGQLLSTISLWLFLAPFAVSLWRLRTGFLVTVFLLTLAPAAKEQTDALAGSIFHAWTYPGIDCCLGFLAAWALRWRLEGAKEVLGLFPSGPVLLFHGWMLLSAALTVCRNLWQSASEFSLRGLAYNVWLTRGISWLDDYYPLQDPFFYSVAVAMLFGVWALLCREGHSLFKRIAGVVLAGACTNLVFGLWQKATGSGWINGHWNISLNAFWPDLHSFGAFMAMAMFLGYGLFAKRASQRIDRAVVGVATLGAAVGLYLSGSRSTLLLVAAALVAGAIWFSLRSKGWRRTLPLAVAIAVVLAIHVALYFGYRGLSYSMLGEKLDPQSLNLALSYRPEIWAAAVRMYLEFPLFGLGQGAFYRLSAVPEFSGSKFLVDMNGEGVHNEFLRILVELGPVGIGILLFAANPVFRLGRANFRVVSFYALLGLALGNVYTNALLVRELLVFAAVFAGCYFWEVQRLEPGVWRPPSTRVMRYGGIAFCVLALAALIEVATSFNRNPFIYGQRCHEVRPFAKDGWTQGAARIPVPKTARLAELLIASDRPDLMYRSATLEVSVIGKSGPMVEAGRYSLSRGVEGRLIRFALPEGPEAERFLELKTSNCYVPLNLGVTYDPRHLGVQLRASHFRTAAGDEAR